MEILQYTPEQIIPAIEFYNALIAEVPHCYPINEEDFALCNAWCYGAAIR